MLTHLRSNTSTSRFALALCAFVLTALLLALPTTAQAHSVLLGTTPDDGEQLAAAPGEVSLLFNEDITELGTEVVVTSEDGEVVSEGEVEIKGPEVIQALAANRPAGAYTVIWRAVSADGHPISGEYVFTAAEAVGGEEETAEEPEEAEEQAPTEEAAEEEAAEEEATGDDETAESEESDEPANADDSSGLSSSTWIIIGVIAVAVIILAVTLGRSRSGDGDTKD